MKILVLGGTRFVGRHIAEAALAAGHEVTLLNRGQTNPDAVPSARRIRADRHEGLGAAADQEWDAVIDVSGYFPADVELAARTLLPVARHYIFISTISVYPLTVEAGADETRPTLDLPADVDDSHPDAYGGRKACCEQVLRDIWREARLTIIRPTFVAGPGDPTDRFTYWVRRVAEGGRMVVPIRLDQALQLIDVRDLAGFTIAAAEAPHQGTYNVAGPLQPLTLGGLIDRIALVAPAHIDRIGVADAMLDARMARLPLTVHGDHPDGLLRVSNRRAVADGLTFRPLDETIRDTLAWDRERGLPPLLAGLEPAAEAELLSAVAR